MADRDQFQIELGITQAGAAGVGGSTSAARSRSGIGEGGAVAGGRPSRGERRANRFLENRLLEDPAKGIIRYAVAESMTQGFSALLPNADHNAFTEVGKIAGEIGMRSIFLQSLKGGAIIGGLTTAISLVTRSVDKISARMEEIEKEQKESRERIRKINSDLARAFAREGNLTKADIQEIRENLYASGVSPI